jgi:hypothetical protein
MRSRISPCPIRTIVEPLGERLPATRGRRTPASTAHVDSLCERLDRLLGFPQARASALPVQLDGLDRIFGSGVHRARDSRATSSVLLTRPSVYPLTKSSAPMMMLDICHSMGFSVL